MKMQLVIFLVKSRLTDRVVGLAKQMGAPGATIINGHGTGLEEARTFFGLELNVSTNMIVFLLEESLAEVMLTNMEKKLELNRPGTGIGFTVDVERVVGMRLQQAAIKEGMPPGGKAYT